MTDPNNPYEKNYQFIDNTPRWWRFAFFSLFIISIILSGVFSYFYAVGKIKFH